MIVPAQNSEKVTPPSSLNGPSPTPPPTEEKEADQLIAVALRPGLPFKHIAFCAARATARWSDAVTA